MRFFESWWECAPTLVRIGLFVATLAALLLGGAADGFWD